MKKGNPKNRSKLGIKKQYNVVEIGSGHNPYRRSNVVVDKFISSNYHRHTDLTLLIAA